MENLVADHKGHLALLGGTSPLAKDLIPELVKLGYECSVFSRSGSLSAFSYDEFNAEKYLGVINLVGGHKLNLASSDARQVLMLDQRLTKSTMQAGSHYVHLSSGAVFGKLSSPASSESPYSKSLLKNTYGELKINLEQDHALSRSLGGRIADLRIFSFVGDASLRKTDYFLSLALQSIRASNTLTISGKSFLRDYISGLELASAIDSTLSSRFSGVANLHTLAPASREDLVRRLVAEFELKVTYSTEDNLDSVIYCASPEGILPNYRPSSSMNIVAREFRKTLAA